MDTPIARRLLALLLPGAGTSTAWWAFLGTDANDVYTASQVGGLVLALVLVGLVVGACVRPGERVAAIASSVVGISLACWMSWSDDETGLFVIGWFLVTVASVPAAIVVVLTGRALRQGAR